MSSSLVKVKKCISDYAKKYHRPVNAVTLLAVTKGQSVERLMSLYQAGHYLFGESYVQEALDKIDYFTRLITQQTNAPPVEWHFIGTIQSNKTKKIAEQFAWVHSVANQKIAQRLNNQRPLHLPLLNICLEVNMNAEATKSGAAMDELLDLADYCSHLPRLALRGLMTIPAPTDEWEQQRQTYRHLHALWQKIRNNLSSPARDYWDTLSMGMSHDMEAAIAEGATIVRIGRALFQQESMK